MEGLGLLLILLLVWVAARLSVAYTYPRAVRRQKKLAKWAVGHELNFNAGKDRDLRQRFGAFHCLWHNGFAFNIMEGNWSGKAVVAFDYSHVVAAGRGSRQCEFSAAVMPTDVVLEPLFVRPKRVRDAAAEAVVGVRDIEFESAEFNRTFFVRAASKRWAYDVLHPRAMDLLLAAPSFHVELSPHGVACYRDGLFKPPDFETACNLASGLLDSLPAYVLASQPRREELPDAAGGPNA